MSRCDECVFYFEGVLIPQNLCMNAANIFQHDAADGENSFARTEAHLTCDRFTEKETTGGPVDDE